MSTIEDFIDKVNSQDFAKAGPMFNELLGAKLSDALDAEKIRLSNQIYNGVEEEDGEQLELDLEDAEETEEETEEEESEESNESDEEEKE